MNTSQRFLVTAVGLAGATLTLIVPYGQAQDLSREQLVQALRRGGQVIVMRHAQSPRQPPATESANADNLKRERQLDEAGRAGASAMGNALRDLKIPIGEVLSSPTYRALETVRAAQIPNPVAVEELGDGGQSMKGVTDVQGEWLRKRVMRPPADTNVLIVTHMPNIARAFPEISNVADGESLIFAADGKGGSRLVGRMKIEEWAQLPKQGGQ